MGWRYFWIWCEVYKNWNEENGGGVFLKLIFKKPGYNHMNPELRKKAKNDFEKVFLKPKNNSAFRKTMKNIHKHSVIKLGTGERRRNCFLPEANYHAAMFFTKFCWL